MENQTNNQETQNVAFQPTIPPSPPPTKIKAWVWMVCSIIILGMGFTIGLLFNKNLSPNSQISPTPTSLFSPTPQAKPNPAQRDTANWKTYTNNDVTFKYPSGWVIDGNSIISTSLAIRLIVVPKGSTLMNECMKLMSTTPIRGLTVKKFERVSSGEMCSTNDTSPREIWVVASEGSYSPGISYKYSTLESDLAETTLDQILSTFKFIDNNAEGTLQATVWRSPTCAGAQRPGENCEAPVANGAFDIYLVVNTNNNESKSKQEIFYSTDGLVKKQTVSTNANGQFTVTLEAGSYQIRNILTGIGNNINDRNFTIVAGQTTTQQFNIDTGIR